MGYYVVKEIGGWNGVEYSESAGPFPTRAEAELEADDWAWMPEYNSQAIGFCVMTDVELDDTVRMEET